MSSKRKKSVAELREQIARTTGAVATAESELEQDASEERAVVPEQVDAVAVVVTPVAGQSTVVVAERKQRKRWSKEARAALSDRLKTFYEKNPQKKKELSDRIKAYWTSARKKEFGDRMRAVFAQPELRKRISIGINRYWDHIRELEKAAKV